MKKATILATLTAGMAMGLVAAIGAHPQRSAKKALDTEIIVEVDRSLESLTSEGIKNTQEAVKNRIRSYVTSNFHTISSFTVVANAFAIRVNGDYVEAIKAVPGVKSVSYNNATPIPQSFDDGLRTVDPNAYGGSENVSAVTMMKPGANESLPGTTNEGEGTLIAVIDTGFYLRAEHKEIVGGAEVTKESWSHETYSALAASVAKRADYVTSSTAGATAEQIAASKEAYLNWVSGTHAYTKNSDYDADPNKVTKIKNTPLEKEGSLYFNSKVPFYFDYGGEKEIHSDYATFDFNVANDNSYHGDHVASIASGNADTYKGIAPKAQLVLMKAGTYYKPTKVEDAVGQQPGGYLYELNILHALEDCLILGVDGINMSLGTDLIDFDSNSITCRTITKLANEGILTSISAGNSGKTSYKFTGGYGNWTFSMSETGIMGGYNNVSEATFVASAQPIRKFFENAFKVGDAYVEFADQVKNQEGMPDDYDVEHEMKELFEGVTSREWVYIPGFGTDSDYSGIDPSGRIAIVNRGSTSFADKYKVAFNKGAIGLVVIDNDPTASSLNLRMAFGDEQPEIPVALILYSDMVKFAPEGNEGTFSLIKDTVADNLRKYTSSDYSSDGPTYDLQLKPEISTPGENIRGAIPPATKEDKEQRELSTYAFFNGTSMAAPNYAGAQSLLFSKEIDNAALAVIREIDAMAITDSFTVEQKQALRRALATNTYRKTIDMRLMSTARILYDYDYDPETYYNSGASHIEEYRYTSPRIQGAGMVDLTKAYNTDIYLEGLDAQGNGIGKSKVELKNSQLINDGIVKIDFIGHNESSSSKTYGAKLVIMRPAVVHNAEVVTKQYNDQGDVDSISNFPGRKYYEAEYKLDPVTHETIFSRAEEHMSATGFSLNDVYRVKKAIKYWASASECELDHPSEDQSTWSEEHMSTIEPGRYYVADIIEEVNGVGEVVSREAVWAPLPEHAFQSTQDTLVAEVELPDITFEPGSHKVSLQQYSLTATQRAAINEYYDYGCYLEGYVVLDSRDSNDPDLNMPFLGYVAGDEGNFETAPVVEPFSFEKDASKVYPSDLVNDIGKKFYGKSNIDLGSEWVTTYVEPGKEFYSDKIMENDESLSHLCSVDNAYHLVGTDPDGNRYANPEQNIYVGSAKTSNTMIIQQFILRSCNDNYFTLKNSSGEVVVQDALRNYLYGDYQHTNPLIKSHLDLDTLGSYVASRGFAVVPLYNERGESFPSGTYELTFNYLLASTGKWVSKSYNVIIDSETPTVKNVVQQGDNIRINITENNLAKLYVGSADKTNDIKFDSSTGEYYVVLSKEEATAMMNENINRQTRLGRLFVGMIDKAYGYTGAIIKFDKAKSSAHGQFKPVFSSYVIAEHYSFESRHDFEIVGNSIKFYTLDYRGDPSLVTIDGYVKVTKFNHSSSGGCGGNIVTTSITLSALAVILAIALIATKKFKKKFGGQEQ